MNHRLGTKLKKARLGRKLSVREAAQKSGVHPNNIWRLERCEGDTYFRTILALLAVYELPLSYLEE